MSKKIPFILSIFILFFLGCTTTEEFVLTPVAKAQYWFDNNVTSENFQILKYAQEIDWNNAIVNTGDHGEIIEVPFTVQSGLKTKVGDQNYLSYHRLLLKKSIDGFTYNHVQVLTKNEYFDNTDKSFNFYQITDDFDGIVLVINQNNEAVQFSSFKNSLLLKPNITGKMAATTCIYLGWQYEDGDFRAISLVGCFGGGGAGSDNDNGGYPPHVGGGGSSSSSNTVAYIAKVIEDKIDDSKLDPCTKVIMSKLKTTTKNDIAEMVSRFGQPGSIFNINIIPGKVGDPNNFAETSKVNGSELDINIILNKDYIDGTDYSSRPTDLSIATTLTHEIIHAYLISATSEFFAGCGLTICDFPTIYDAYVAYQATKNTSIGPDAHEELIATKYVNTIAETVQEFHIGKPVAAGMATQVYTDLSISGLYGTKYFNKKYPNDPNHSLYKDRQRIIKRIHAERSGANFGEITLAGTPCNK